MSRRCTRTVAITITLLAPIATGFVPAITRASAAPAAAPAPESSRGWAHVAVDTSATGEAGPVIRRRVQERADVVLRRAGVMPGRGRKDPTISVVIREIAGAEPAWEYTITVARADEPKPVGQPQRCPLCTETELVDAIEGRLATIAAALEDTTPDVDGDPTAAVPEPSTTTAPTTPIVDPGPTPSRGLGTKGKAGIALLAVGGIGVVVGVVLAVLPAKPKSDDPTREVFTQPPGYAALGVGAAAIIVGAVLLGLDRKKARSRTRKAARLQIQPGLRIAF